MKNLFILLFIISLNFNLFSQEENNWRYVFFDCAGNYTDIPILSDFIGPKYFYFEGGNIVNFNAPDTCVISVLCSDVGALELDSTYQITNNQLIDENIDVIITGNLGPNAFEIIEKSGVKAYKCDGIVIAEAIEKYKKGELEEIKMSGPAHHGAH